MDSSWYFFPGHHLCLGTMNHYLVLPWFTPYDKYGKIKYNYGSCNASIGVDIWTYWYVQVHWFGQEMKWSHRS